MRGLAVVAVALTGLGSGCHRSAMPPRPDGAAVVISPESTDDGVPTAPELEPNDTPATAQRLLVAPAAPAAVAATLQPRAPGPKHDVDFFQISAPSPDAGAPAAAPPDAGGPPPRPPFLVRADVRPAAGLTVTLEALDAAGHVLVTAAGSQPGEAVAIPNLPLAPPATALLRVRAAGEAAGATSYRLTVHLVPFDAGAEIEPNGDAAHATDLQPGSEAVGYLGWRRDQDWYRLPTAAIPEGGVLSVDLDPVPEVGASLQLYGADGHKLTEARGRKGERVVLRNVRVPAGDAAVFLVVRADTNWSADARYNLRPRADLPKAGTEAEPNDDQAHAQAIGDGTVTGYLARGDVDFFRYSTDGMALLDVEVAPPERGGVEVEVTREDNTLLARAQSLHHTPARIAGQPIPGGPVLIRVVPRHGAVDSDDPYRLTVSSRPAPALAPPTPATGGAPKAE
ncbi:MAG TPA: hypothetical protein VKZ18_03165 [Polyangia bacterium]|nr:hypothetical protein [Polyangia bacterium]